MSYTVCTGLLTAAANVCVSEQWVIPSQGLKLYSNWRESLILTLF